MNNDHTFILNKLKSFDFVNYINANFKIKSILVFGSAVNGDFTEESDVDIAILGNDKFKIQDILKIELFLEDFLNRSIDVVDLNSTNLDIFIKMDILKTGVSIYTTDNNTYLDTFIDKTDWYYKENQYYFSCRKRDLLS